MVGRGGLEPPTSRLSGVRSNHLSYRPKMTPKGSPMPDRRSCVAKAAARASLAWLYETSILVEPRRIELLTS